MKNVNCVNTTAHNTNFYASNISNRASHIRKGAKCACARFMFGIERDFRCIVFVDTGYDCY